MLELKPKKKPNPLNVYEILVSIGVDDGHPSYLSVPRINDGNEKFMQINMPIQLDWLKMIAFSFSYELGELIERFTNLSNEDIEQLYNKYKAIEFSRKMNKLEVKV